MQMKFHGASEDQDDFVRECRTDRQENVGSAWHFCTGFVCRSRLHVPRWGAADVEIKVPSVENPEL